jgi:hypothetical protein
MRNGWGSLVFIAITLTLCLGRASQSLALALLADDFESLGSLTNQGWIARSLSFDSHIRPITTNAERTFGGRRSTKLPYNPTLDCRLKDLDLDGDLNTSVQLFDNSHTGDNHEKWGRAFFDSRQRDIIVMAYNQDTSFTPIYLLDATDNGNWFGKNSGTTRVSRWHKFSFLVEDSIDGTKVTDDAFSVFTLEFFLILVAFGIMGLIALKSKLLR